MIHQYDMDFGAADVIEWVKLAKQKVQPALFKYMDIQKQGFGAIQPKEKFPEEKHIELARHIFKYLGMTSPSVTIRSSKAHSQTVNYGVNDISVSLKVWADHPLEIVKDALHEAGHALYYQGRPRNRYWFSQPVSDPRGRVIEESCAIYFETMFVKNPGFLKYLEKAIAEVYGVSGPEWSWQNMYLYFTHCNPQDGIDFTNTANDFLETVMPSDVELTLMSGDVKFSNYTAIFKQASNNIFRIDTEEVPDKFNRRIFSGGYHWSGDWGYRPLYIPAYLMAAQFDKAIRKEITGLDRSLERGRVGSVIDWWQRNVFSRGSMIHTMKLLERATGQSFSHKPFVDEYSRVNSGTRPKIVESLISRYPSLTKDHP